MILTCKSCKANYLVPAAVFASGQRMVRCARCTHSWMADLPPRMSVMPMEALHASASLPQEIAVAGGLEKQSEGVGAALESSKTPSKKTTPVKNLPAVRRRVPWARIRVGAEILSGALVLAALVYFFVTGPFAESLAHKTQRLFYAVGLTNAPSGDGLVLQNVRSERRFENGGMQLVIEGLILNQTSQRHPVPDINVNALGPDKKIIQSWRIEAPKATLPAGASTPFRSSIVAPTGAVMEVNLSFAEPRHDSKP